MKKKLGANYVCFILIVVVSFLIGIVGETQEVAAQEVADFEIFTMSADKQAPKINEDMIISLTNENGFSVGDVISFHIPRGLEWQPWLTEELSNDSKQLFFRWDEKQRLLISQNRVKADVTKVEIGVTARESGNLSIQSYLGQKEIAELKLTIQEPPKAPSLIKTKEEILMPELGSNPLVREIPPPLTRAISRRPIDHLGLVINEKFQQPTGRGPYFLTPKILVFTDGRDQNGAIWSRKKLNLKQDFKLGSYLFLGDVNARNAADGMTFTLQNDERMATVPRAVIGVKGMGLGVYGDGSGPYVRNALSIEFDTFHNRGSMDVDIGRNSNRGHIAVAKPKLNNASAGQHMHTQLVQTNHLSNNMWRRFEVTWNSAEKELSFSLVDPANKTEPWSYGQVTPGTRTVTFKVDPLKEFGSEEVYWGFTGSTGSLYQENAIVIDEVPQEPVVRQTNTIKNITSQSAPALSVKGSIDELLEVSSRVEYTSGYYPWEKAITNYTIPEGLDYVPNSSLIDGQPIRDTEIEFRSGTIAYPMYRLTFDNRQRTFSYQLRISENETKRYEITSRSIGEELEVESENLRVENEELGVVIVTYQDTQNNELGTKQLTGKAGTAYETEQLTFDGFTFLAIDSGGSAGSGEFKKELQRVIYRYERLYMKVELDVFHAGTNQIADTARVSDKLDYRLTLTSHYTVPGAFYDELRVVLPVDTQLAQIDPDSLVFRSEDGRYSLDVTYNENTGEIVGVVKEPVPRHLTYLLEYQIAVKDLTPIGSLITGQGTVEGVYSDGFIIPTLQSNEVKTEIVPGFLEFISAPKVLSFGKLKIAISEQTYSLDESHPMEKLAVKDNRMIGSAWSMKAKITKKITSSTSQNSLGSDLYYLSNNVPIPLSEDQGAIIYTKVSDSHQLIAISDSWNHQNGLRLTVKPGIARSENYEGEIQWTLQDAPENL